MHFFPELKKVKENKILIKNLERKMDRYDNSSQLSEVESR